MEEDLHKRLKEASVNITVDIVNRDLQPVYFAAIREAAVRGAEQGYKEAVKEAINWWNYNLLSNYHNAEAYVEKRITKEELFEFFEKEMLNLLEEKK